MSGPTVEETVRRFYEAFQPGQAHRLEQALSPDWIDQTLPPGRSPGVAGMVEALARLQQLLPDLETQLVKVLPVGDTVCTHVIFSGTHEGALFGSTPTHRRVSFMAFDIHRVAEGRIVESWHLEDNLGLLVQIGVIPPLG